MAGLSQNECPVRWRDGVHIEDTSIWFDARRSRDVCIVSAADQVTRARHGQLVSTQESAYLLEGAKDLASTGLQAPYNRPFTLGTTRVELFRSGYGLGAASVRVDLEERSFVYAGRVLPRGTKLGGKADIRTCDSLIISARYSHLELPDTDHVVDELVRHCQRTTRAGGVAVLMVRSFLQGMELAALLSNACPTMALRGHFSLVDGVRRVSELGLVAAIKTAAREEEIPHALIWPMNRRDKLDSLELPKGSNIALVSGAADEPNELTRARVDHGFPWRDEADGPALRDYIEATSAREVYWMDSGEEISPFLKKLPMTRRVGPPMQMNLFSQSPARRQSDRIA